ncbi:hypothetical protein ASPWEDRAFT_48012 [Aspergillus wentii DTO 134E9]|uniref:Protein PBN1 n=1 Tax=Aspergillus wentii DTO 134E9 TaxID=1073089 RepID=A0A1L9S2Q4_ASPWE|nr:uncharacterized protein ASPWEDRAFT_48012 [Aspergillus wentii DTO 134E9]KAI9924474.1 protease B nonderepressible form [Aspergillus wentii]OJJ41431.1 hypothetical protein ASPWEDRAFT_48012 [Aspergillus wentii DTO 134E9]
MRRRITFVQRSEAPFEQDQAALTPDALSVTNLDAVREERATFSFEELPSELSQVLKECHQLHIRWATERPYDTIAPFSSRVSPGLHVFFTPGTPHQPTEALCPLLKKVFGEEVDCSSPEVSFTTPPILSTRFASTASFQFHSLLPSPDTLVKFIQQTICGRSDEGCQNQGASILSADSIDINYDSISHALTVSGLWSKVPEKGWTEKIGKDDAGADKVEVGLLGAERSHDLEEIKMGGLLGVVGSDEKLSPTLFSFPSRHHPLPDDAVYTVSFPSPAGLHPTMTISMPRSSLKPPPAPEDATCALHTYLTLPSSIFGDKYQLSTSDQLFLQSHNLVALRAVSGETDLEAPDWVVPQWGSNWLLEVASPSESDQGTDNWNVTVPLHLRYLPPSESGYRTAEVPWPVVFWACTAEEGTKMSINPFDRVNLGWVGLFGPRTMFYQLHPAPSGDAASQSRLVEELDVPVLPLNDGGLFHGRVIELGTVAVIVLGSLWVLWKLGLVARSSGTGAQKKDKQGKDK